jgi:hypothetical protein
VPFCIINELIIQYLPFSFSPASRKYEVQVIVGTIKRKTKIKHMKFLFYALVGPEKVGVHQN